MAFPTSGCVAYYKLNEGAGTTRLDSVGSNNLVDHNTVGSSAGKISNAADFVGSSSQYLSRVDSAAFQMGTGDFTIVAWVKFTSTTDSQFIAAYGQSGSSGYGLFVKNDGSGVGVAAFIADNAFGVHVLAGLAVNDGGWHLMIADFPRGGTCTIYKDNASYSTGSIATVTGSVNNTNGFSMGARYDAANFYTGSVDESGIWNRVLTSGERTTLWNSGAGLTFPVASAVQRRTLSSIGTRTGSRQLQGI